MTVRKRTGKRSDHEYPGEEREPAVSKAAAKEEPLATFTQDFNHAAQDNAKVFVFVLVPVLALFLFILFYRNYKKYAPHLIFATHYFTFYLISYIMDHLE